MAMIRMKVNMSEEQSRALKAAAARKGISVAAYVRYSLERSIEEDPPCFDQDEAGAESPAPTSD